MTREVKVTDTELFIDMWNDRESREDIAAHFGVSEGYVSELASRLRAEGRQVDRRSVRAADGTIEQLVRESLGEWARTAALGARKVVSKDGCEDRKLIERMTLSMCEAGLIEASISDRIVWTRRA